MPIDTIISIVGVAITIAAFLVRMGAIQNRIEVHEKRTDRLCDDLEGGLHSVREDAKKMEARVVQCESTAQLTASELHRLTMAIEANTQVTSQLSHQMARMEEREKARDRRAGQS